MAGVTFDISQGLLDAQALVQRMIDEDGDELLVSISELVVGQTKVRIYEEKRAPDSAAWPAWSAEYAATRKPNHSLLLSSGDLADSIQPFAAGGEAGVGSNLVYAATQQFGSEDGRVPARAYLGVSDENREEIELLAQDWFEGMIP